MEVILNLIPNTGGSVQPASAAPIVGSATTAPSVLAGLPVGATIQGFVLNRDAQGNPILRTERGDFSLQSQFFLKIGSDVLLRIDQSGAQPKAHIVSVDGLPPAQAETIPAHATDNDVVQQGPVSSQNTGRAATPATLTASTTTARAAGPTLPGGGQAGVFGGTLTQPPALPGALSTLATVSVRLVQLLGAPPPVVTAPDATEATEAETTPSTGARSSTPSSATGYGAYTRTPATPATTPTPPGDASPAAALSAAGGKAVTPLPAPGGAITATVVQIDAAGEPIFATPHGLLRLHTPLPLQPGATVQLTLLSAAQTETSMPTSTLPTLAGGWSTLQSILHTLLSENADVAATLARQLSPGTSEAPTAFTQQGLSAGLFFFLQALKNGSARSFIGEPAARALEAGGHHALLNQAEAEFSLLKAAFADHATPANPTAPQPWQPLFLPVLVEGEMRNVRFYTKRERRKAPDGTADHQDTRFVVEVELSALGPVQLDGLVKKQYANPTRFDLIFRTHGWLDEEDQNALRALFTNAGEVTGFQGSLLFQMVDDFPVRPLEELMQTAHQDVRV